MAAAGEKGVEEVGKTLNFLFSTVKFLASVSVFPYFVACHLILAARGVVGKSSLIWCLGDFFLFSLRN